MTVKTQLLCMTTVILLSPLRENHHGCDFTVTSEERDRGRTGGKGERECGGVCGV